MSRTKDRTYLRKRARIRNQDVCWLCNGHIDMELKWPHPKSWSADHVNPVGVTGNNHGDLMPAHLDCNQSRGKKTPTQPTRHARQW